MKMFTSNRVEAFWENVVTPKQIRKLIERCKNETDGVVVFVFLRDVAGMRVGMYKRAICFTYLLLQRRVYVDFYRSLPKCGA